MAAKQYMQSLCENKQLIGKVRKVPMSPEPLEYIHKHTGNQLRRYSISLLSDKLEKLFQNYQSQILFYSIL